MPGYLGPGMPSSEQLASVLAAEGFVAAADEAAELISLCGSVSQLSDWIGRRLSGEPLAWITSRTVFCGMEIAVAPGVYVPRWQTEALVMRAAELAVPGSVVADVCTGSGAIAKVLKTTCPGATVFACDSDPVAVGCAKSNGVDAHLGHLLEALPRTLTGMLDLVISVPPYVPRDQLEFLPSGALEFEKEDSYCGGDDGLDLAREILAQATDFLTVGGRVLMEVGHGQDEPLERCALAKGYEPGAKLYDEDGDLRGVELSFRG